MGVMGWLFRRIVERRMIAFQNELIQQHYDEVQNIYKQMRGWRHDYHNHIQAMKAHLSLGRTEELEAYLNKLDADLSTIGLIVQTGNVMVDAILNSKLSLIASRSVQLNAKAAVPEKLGISEIDLCVIIGNLLDNALEACMKLERPEDRFIRVYIGVLKEQLYISVTNSVGGGVRRADSTYLSTKGSASHGFGLIRIDRIVDKYGGYVNRQSEEGVFATEVLLPL